ncbi:hypothetical protein [Chitinasiproducens palmae]|uniref:hypothetical protein n=1 Tax=Chitinasiproducens palmae TaxID=1770053 RepID=UPI0011133C29|nr:hypothetical protein [Chitinasiproducens palmae]
MTDVPIALPPGAAVPRIGEIVRLMPSGPDNALRVRAYVVLSVATSIFRRLDDHGEVSVWHTTVTLGPDSGAADRRYLVVHE